MMKAGWTGFWSSQTFSVIQREGGRCSRPIERWNVCMA